jgi:glyoxylase-like metal-dependent hydrolase (beta-lactamase superfamily II)
MTAGGGPVPGIDCLAIPTPFAVGPVNCWLIDDDPLTLVDCGPNWGTALDALESQLREHGRRVEDLERIVITHQHSDHLGLAGILVERSGAEVAALDLLAPVLEDSRAAAEDNDELAMGIMLRHGTPRDVVLAVRSLARAYTGWGSGAPVSRPLPDGGTLEFAGRRLEVLHRPGHSPSDTVFLDNERGVALGGDHLLPRVSSNPLISRALGGRSGDPANGRPHALELYIASLRETRATPIEVILPGHGEPVEDHVRLIDERFAMTERRAARIAGLVAERSRTAHDIARAMWGDVAVSQAYLTLCEVLGHLDLLVARGAVREAEADGIVQFEPA